MSYSNVTVSFDKKMERMNTDLKSVNEYGVEI